MQQRKKVQKIAGGGALSRKSELFKQNPHKTKGADQIQGGKGILVNLSERQGSEKVSRVFRAKTWQWTGRVLTKIVVSIGEGGWVMQERIIQKI